MATGYVVNNGNYTNTDLNSIIPKHETFRVFVSTTATSVSGTVYLRKNTTGQTNYVVIATFENGTNPSAYITQTATQNINTINIRPRTAGSFVYNFTKGSGLFEGYINFLVVYV